MWLRYITMFFLRQKQYSDSANAFFFKKNYVTRVIDQTW
jgi:hypothetical protein